MGVFMATCAGFLVALIGVLGVGTLGTPSFPMMSMAAAFIGFCSGAFMGYYFSETEEFNKWVIRLTAGLLMGVSVNAISTGGDIMVTFMNSVAKAREDPGYINDARKASIILATEGQASRCSQFSVVLLLTVSGMLSLTLVDAGIEAKG